MRCVALGAEPTQRGYAPTSKRVSHTIGGKNFSGPPRNFCSCVRIMPSAGSRSPAGAAREAAGIDVSFLLESQLREQVTCTTCAALSRTSDSESFDAKRRLANADRHALAVLAAGADAQVEFHVVADHLHSGQGVGTVADQRGSLDEGSDAAVFDQVGLGRGEQELAVGDVDLATAEVGGIKSP